MRAREEASKEEGCGLIGTCEVSMRAAEAWAKASVTSWVRVTGYTS
jgi:hypothetical protein